MFQWFWNLFAEVDDRHAPLPPPAPPSETAVEQLPPPPPPPSPPPSTPPSRRRKREPRHGVIREKAYEAFECMKSVSTFPTPAPKGGRFSKREFIKWCLETPDFWIGVSEKEKAAFSAAVLEKGIPVREATLDAAMNAIPEAVLKDADPATKALLALHWAHFKERARKRPRNVI